MSIQTKVGAPALDATDFQTSFAGATVGLKLRYIPTQDGAYVSNVLLCEKAPDGSWTYKATMAQDFLDEIKSAGSVLQWIRTVLIPKINAWLKARFSGVVVEPPSNVPAALVELDKLLLTLKVAIVDGVPQVSI